MIASINHLPELTKENRIAIAQRAIQSNPFWHLLSFDVPVAKTESLYSTRLEINEDFFITDLRGNFGDIYFAEGGITFDLTVFEALNDRTLYRYPQSPLLPSPFVVSEARFDVAVLNQVMDDRQIERFPFKVNRGDRIIGEIQPSAGLAVATTAEICLAGFQAGAYDTYLAESDTQRINESLSRPVRYDLFKFTVDHEGFNKDYLIENDRFPRLILAFGAVNSTADKGLLSASTMRIEDFNRNIKFTNEAIPIQYIAPRLTCLNDEVFYYLPMEYYFEPFNAIRFNISNDSPNPADPQGYDFYALTRTI